MTIRIDDINKNAPLVRAAYAMVRAHRIYETMVPAIDCVRNEFPGVPDDHLICLWVGINARDRE